MDLSHALQVAIEAADEAGALLRRGVNERKVVSRKSTAVDLLTEHDQAAEALITARLRAHFPDHRLVAEEGQEKPGDGDRYTWYIDPLDGTNNFTHGFPVFAVSIALYEAGRPLLGVVFDPMRDECFSAVTGQGASLRSGDRRRSIQVSREVVLLDSLLATGFPYDRHQADENNIAQLAAFLKTARGIRRAGSASLDMAYVAAGRLDGYWEFKLSSWDIAAGVCLVQEAGGKVTGVDGAPLQIAPRLSLIASNGRIHESMGSVLRGVNGQSYA
ncbi:MAG: inositol monophosphatase [Chloroflexota bacterium]|nr:MAG: inositol monophosphatase [Chloroflexota bacterium]